METNKNITIKSNTGIYITITEDDLKMLKERWLRIKEGGVEENPEIVIEINGVKKEFKFSDFNL